MILGMSTATYTFVHVWISLLGIGTGFVVMFGLLAGRRLNSWTTLLLTTTVATSVTGFGLPFDHLLPHTSSASYRWLCLRSRYRRVMCFTSPVPGVGFTW
jgi:hypothetical protein